MIVGKRSAEKREIDLAEIARLLRRGYSHREIAVKLKLSAQQVGIDVKTLMERCREESLNDIVAHRERILSEYREVKKEAWEAWEKSKNDRYKRTEETSTSAIRSGGRIIETTEEGLPSSEHLRTVMSCLTAERDILGVDAPKQVEARVETINWDIIAGEIDLKTDTVEDRMRRVLGLPVKQEGDTGKNILECREELVDPVIIDHVPDVESVDIPNKPIKSGNAKPGHVKRPSDAYKK